MGGPLNEIRTKCFPFQKRAYALCPPLVGAIKPEFYHSPRLALHFARLEYGNARNNRYSSLDKKGTAQPSVNLDDRYRVLHLLRMHGTRTICTAQDATDVKINGT